MGLMHGYILTPAVVVPILITPKKGGVSQIAAFAEIDKKGKENIIMNSRNWPRGQAEQGGALPYIYL